MSKRHAFISVLSALLQVLWWLPACGQTPQIVSTSPAQNALNVPISSNISVTFDVDMDETTINDSTFVVNARSTGLHPGTISYDGPSKTATFDPVDDFDEGEVVTVVLTTVIESSGGTPLDSAYVWSFTSIVYDGSGTFAPHSIYPVGDYPVSVFSADLDGDGDLDLATANEHSASVSVLLNNGDGSFATHSVYAAGDGPWSVFSADLDGDGDLDLAVADYYSDSVSVLLNHGDGTFAPHSVYA
ncbi:MAG: Ig-like domain-containing protein, partial [Candidatus Zixiibacteriota bacterium]